MKSAKRRIRKVKVVQLNLNVEYRVGQSHLPDKRALYRWAKAALLTSNREAEIGVRLVDEEEGQVLNRDYRGKDYATNVLTFALHEGEASPPGMPLFGDIVLTVPVIEREAHEQGKPLEAHFAHLTVHSMLHLQGFNHIEEAEAEAMEALEIRILQQLGYPNPYGEEHA